jgi:hypothetical protein
MELTQAEWSQVERIARELARDVDRNELGKIVAYAQRTRDTERILQLAKRLPQSGYVRSRRTRGYTQRIARVLQRELSGMKGDLAMAILSWAFRLMTIYQTEMGTRRSSGRRR